MRVGLLAFDGQTLASHHPARFGVTRRSGGVTAGLQQGARVGLTLSQELAETRYQVAAVCFHGEPFCGTFHFGGRLVPVSLIWNK